MLSTSVMLKPASGSCNMRCKYCFYYDEMENRAQSSYGFMSEETLKNVIRKTMLQTEQEITYAFQGGEPTLRGLDFFKKAIEFQKKYNFKGIRVANALQTNGYALNEDWCRFLKENNFLVGVSVDGTKELHNSFRPSADGKPTYNSITRSIQLLEKYKVDYNILTVVTEETAKHPAEVYRDFMKRGWYFQQYIECLDPLGACCASPYSLTPETYGVFLTQLFDLWYADFKKGRQPYIRRFDNYVGMLAGFPPEACEQRGECGIQLVVEADGSAYPCDFYVLDEYRLGNFNTDRLPQMNEKREEIGFIQRSHQLSAQCRACPYFGLCRGGCQRTRDYLPEEDAYISHFCKSYQYFFDHCLDRLKEAASHVR